MRPHPCRVSSQTNRSMLSAIMQHGAPHLFSRGVCTADTKAEDEPDPKKPAKEEGNDGSAAGDAKQEGTLAEKESAAKEEDDSKKPTVVEEGRVTFWYRPKVERAEAHSIDDIQRCVCAMQRAW